MPLVLFLLPHTSLYVFLPLALPVRCPPCVRFLVLHPLVVLLFGLFGYLRVVCSVPLALLLLSVYFAPTFFLASLVRSLDGSGLLGSLLASCGCFVFRPRGRCKGEFPVFVDTGSSSRTCWRSPIDVVGRRLSSPLRSADDFGRRRGDGWRWPHGERWHACSPWLVRECLCPRILPYRRAARGFGPGRPLFR